MRPTRLISCLAIIGTLLAMAAVPASAAGVSVSATPNKMLADGQQISVSGAGFSPGAFVAVVECPTTTVSPDACDLNTVNFANADATGAFSDVPFVVSRVLSDGTDCALDGGCYVGVQDANNGGPTAAALITFDPSIPPFVLTARVDKTDKVNAKGVVTLTGTVHCSGGNGGDVFIETDLRQVVGRAIFTSFGNAFVSCAANSTVPFRVTVRPQNGLFGPGAASVRIFAQSGSHGTSHKVAVMLVLR
jgi:Neocarzinostatin family